MTHLTQIGTVFVPVSDQEQALAFYAEKLGFERRGYTLLTKAQKEPWGQIVTRLLSPEGILVAVTVTPGMRK